MGASHEFDDRPSKTLMNMERTYGFLNDAWRSLGDFIWKQAKSCAFAGPFLILLMVSTHIPSHLFARYDFLFVGAIAIQALLIYFRVENIREVLVLSAFHALGMGLELYKTSPGVASWSYPQHCFFRIGTVPLYSGFMYASVASYIMQAWRQFDLSLTRFPRQIVATMLCAAIYINFFTERCIGDVRLVLAVIVLFAFGRTLVEFTVGFRRRRMPVLLSFFLIGLFIWLAENYATYFGAWVYPHQRHGWAMVAGGKIGSWTLLIIISFIIVAALKREFPGERGNVTLIERGDAPADTAACSADPLLR